MRTRDDGVAATIRAAHQFIAQRDELRGVADTGTYRKVGELLDRIEQQAVAQQSEFVAGKGATQSALDERQNLLDELRAIAGVARMLEVEHPELRAIRMPKESMAATRLISHALAMIDAAARRRKMFVRLGLPDDFPDQVAAVVARFKEATGQPRQHAASRRGATAGAESDLARARKHLRVLDSFVRSAADGNEALLGAWIAVSKLPRRKKAKDRAVAALEAPGTLALPARGETHAIAAPAQPLLLPAPATPAEVTAEVVDPEPAERPARWTLRGSFGS